MFLKNNFLHNFHEYFQLQVLTKVHAEQEDQVDGQNTFFNSGIHVVDILKNDSLLSCFMEFMDSSPTFSPGQCLIEFWLCCTNFRYVAGVFLLA